MAAIVVDGHVWTRKQLTVKHYARLTRRKRDLDNKPDHKIRPSHWLEWSQP